jgi:hypothetical protein
MFFAGYAVLAAQLKPPSSSAMEHNTLPVRRRRIAMQKQVSRWRGRLVLIGILGSVVAAPVSAECTRAVHTFCGVPDDGDTLIRQGYLLSYDADRRVPRWVAYKIEPDYLNTPQRTGRLSSFRTDPDIDNPVTDADYVGLKAARGFARGHLAPWKAMGGDRDGDGVYAHFDTNLNDVDDEQTI